MADEKVRFSQKNVILDIEGTTVPIDFTKNVYFKYVLTKLQQNIDEMWDKKEFQSAVEPLEKKFAENAANNTLNRPVSGKETRKESFVKNVSWHMQLGKKSNILHQMRELQGYILQTGYATGELTKLEIYPDTLDALKLWKEKGRNIYLYSAGDEKTQRISFSNTIFGDLSQYFSAYFDLTKGDKTETSSYVGIAKILNCSTSEIIFVTDSLKEAEAAEQAGVQSLIADRPGNTPYTPEDRAQFKFITSFNQLVPVS